VLQEVAATPPENDQLKRLTRRRRQLVNEKVRIVNRLHADLQAVSPGLLGISRQVDNLWFLRFLTCRDELSALARLKRQSVLRIRGIGQKYAAIIQAWQANAHFADDVAWVGEMIIEDARRVLALLGSIKVLDEKITEIAEHSGLAKRIASIPGYGDTCSAELAGEIGTLERFNAESGLAIYLGMAPLAKRSGQTQGTKPPRHVNTRAKAAMMTAVARHIACVPQSKAYYDRKRAEGKKHNQAIRATGRHLVRVMWAMMKQDRDYELRP
jgi:transposase